MTQPRIPKERTQYRRNSATSLPFYVFAFDGSNARAIRRVARAQLIRILPGEAEEKTNFAESGYGARRHSSECRRIGKIQTCAETFVPPETVVEDVFEFGQQLEAQTFLDRKTLLECRIIEPIR